MKKHTRSVFALLLVVLMAVGMMPFGAFATDTGTDPAKVTEEPIEPEVPLSEEPTEHDITEPVEESDIEVPAEIQLATRYSAGGNITVYNYFHAFFVISEMNCIDGSPFLTSKSSWPGDSASDWGSCGGKYDLFYCIDFYAHGNANGATTKPGTPLEETPAWKAISSAGKKGIQLALIYGVPNCSSYYDNVYGYEATQIIIWEYQLGVRTDASQTVSFFNTTLGRYPKIKEAYDAILSNIKRHQTEPNFHGKTVELKNIGETYAITLTDANGTFQNDQWSIEGTHPGVEVRQSGNNLKVWATACGGEVDITLKRKLNIATGNALCAFTGEQSCVTGVADDPLFAKLTVKLPSVGKLKIVKTAPDGMNKSNIRFDIYEGYTNLSEGKVFASVYTNADGVTYADGLIAGKNYYVREIVPENSKQKPDWTISGAEKSGTSADAAWFTAVAGSTVQINCTNDWDYGSAEITKVTDDGKNTANRVFYLYDGWSNYEADKRFAELTTNAGGKTTVAKLIPGHWYYLIEKNFLPTEDGMPEWEITGVDEWKVSNGAGTRVAMFRPKGGDSIQIVCKNPLLPTGKITVEKSKEDGTPLTQTTFLLEYSKDGTTWKPVEFSAGQFFVGCCSSPSLDNGTLTTDKTGSVTFDGLAIQDVTYRLTEVKSQDGKQLMAEILFEGSLTEDKEITIRAVNNEVFLLPFTGSNGFMTATISILIMGASLLAVFFAARKKTHNTTN
ncbi:MAG: SpaA isopeptide-forming pilin-related protein [Faecousia sp.]